MQRLRSWRTGRGLAYRGLGALLLGLTLGGCALTADPRHEDQLYLNIPEPLPPLPNGSIYQPGSAYHPLFEDRRPRMVGDILTIVLDEEVSATKSSEANADRSGSASFEAGETPEVLEQLADYAYEMSGESSFSGGGDAESSNTLTGTITVTVVDVLANQNLRVRGNKRIAINQGSEVIRFSGVVNPRTISGNNTVPSNQVAQARIDYVGDGYINESQQMGGLQRFFLNISPF
ncbi:flagellar basal body L-ring protein FlgH [Halomonas sp. YLGW01]|uniref:flagellar basal body L-ring protein FlgH n=1 Tax=Halomonas sp. YLGW01 TaxID=2773308 RepID=UPI001780FD41|nr:flagellar basal body L-ring protein FlgH [Halomonas sp. YLGW01]